MLHTCSQLDKLGKNVIYTEEKVGYTLYHREMMHDATFLKMLHVQRKMLHYDIYFCTVG